MAKVKVWKRKDGGISITPVNQNDKKEGETDEEYLERQAVVIRKNSRFAGAEEFIMDPNDLPARDPSTRDKWRLSGNKKSVVVDNSVETREEKRRSKKNVIKAKLKTGQPLTEDEAEALLRRM